MTAKLSRRDLLAASLALTAAPARADVPSRIVALDWGWTSTLLALGAAPVGVAEKRSYADWVRSPALPAGVAEVGLRTDPSFEDLIALKPDLILTNPLNESTRARLELIAPTFDNPTFSEAMTPMRNATAAARALGVRIGRRDAAEVLIGEVEARVARARVRLGTTPRAPLLPLSLVDSRHLILYGRGSLFNDMLLALGLHNGFDGPTSLWGHASRSIADLATLPATDLLIVAPTPAEAHDLIDGPSLLTALLAAKGRRAFRLPAVWTYGDLTAAARFAELVAEALTGAGTRA